ncbi:MAG TPA: DUF6152 family protein [Candidatus Acidoferrales bacterium]|nr:DUF6152 family protein [Candidatus Acidoferrales bacterium]
MGKLTELRKFSFSFVCILFLALAALPAFAHHGTSGYELDKIVTVTGTVEEFDWSNPHAVVHITAKNDKGEPQSWTIELGAPGIMARSGWSKNSMKPGDEVIAETHPAKNGVPSGLSATSTILLKFIVNGQALPSR